MPRPLEPPSGGRIRRRLDGSKAELAAVDRIAPPASRVARRQYADILAALGDYESQERSAMSKKLFEPAAQKRMDQTLAQVDKLVETWLRDQRDLGPADARARALATLKPRLADQRHQLARPDYLTR